MERASDRKSCFHCTWNRDAVWKISEDHDSADSFPAGCWCVTELRISYSILL